jgi:uncharacterized protein
MVRFILFVILLLFLLYTLLYTLFKGMPMWREKSNRESEPEELVQDPYCQTYIPKRTAVRKRVKGRDYYFCNRGCLSKFIEEKKS